MKVHLAGPWDPEKGQRCIICDCVLHDPLTNMSWPVGDGPPSGWKEGSWVLVSDDGCEFTQIESCHLIATATGIKEVMGSDVIASARTRIAELQKERDDLLRLSKEISAARDIIVKERAEALSALSTMISKCAKATREREWLCAVVEALQGKRVIAETSYQHAEMVLRACSRENEHMKPENIRLLGENKKLRAEREWLCDLVAVMERQRVEFAITLRQGESRALRDARGCPENAVYHQGRLAAYKDAAQMLESLISLSSESAVGKTEASDG